MKPRTIPPAVLQSQHDASDPEVSAWASANAGSGKTHVLTQRVIKLLLQGEDPAKILCITFTKAAASTMATRVFDTLAAWTALDDNALDAAIRAIGARADARTRQRARQLFARALETPGGLKVQTIHAFCTRLLHQFPFEANVGANFEVMDEATGTQMLDDLTMQVMLEGAAKPDSAIGRALNFAIRAGADQTFRDIVSEAVGKQDVILQWVERIGSLAAAMAELSETLGIAPGVSADDLRARILSEAEVAQAEWSALALALPAGGKSYMERAAALTLAAAGRSTDMLTDYLSLFCTKAGERRKNLVTAALRREHPEWADKLLREQDRICLLLDQQRAAECRDRTGALIAIAYEVITRYRKSKERRGLLDYDDLIDRTLALFRRTSAAWVLYKLDLGINHLLLDEAQDTSPKQWEIVATLVEEFTAGAGARNVKRTMFAVGDDKQSIFSFQGAAPEKFGAMRRTFETAFTSADLGWRNVPLLTSFRSSDIVLQAVDTVFAREIAYRGLSSDSVKTVHQALPDALPGCVDIWPLIAADPKAAIEGWDAPFDTTSEQSPTVRLARRIARHVEVWRRQGLAAGDVLVLVRKRGPLFEAIIRALKDAQVPVAGADRLVLTEHIAVMDLLVLADALLLPQDDLALATVLKSPVFGLSEDDLFEIAWNRGSQSLRAALLAKEQRFPQAVRLLNSLSAQALTDTPFAFYARLLGPGGARRRFAGRVGPEADDALDEFLNLALAYEKTETPTLQGFVAWIRAANTSVKRDMEMARDEVRVMTVHGAKGLEAHTVILAETTARPEGHHSPRLLELPLAGGTGLVWAGSDDTGPVAEALQAAKKAQADEYRRLLYVAMTRAERRLIVCGTSGPLKKDGTPPINEACWYKLVSDALATEGCADEVAADDGEGVIWRCRTSAAVTGTAKAAEKETRQSALPGWIETSVAPDPEYSPALQPSQTDGREKGTTNPGQTRNSAIERGRLLHRLVQSLPDIPPARREDAAASFLARNREHLTQEDCTTLARKTLALLDDPQCAELFAPGSRAEVPLAGHLQRDGRPPLAVTGQADRLAVTPEKVMIADYKTNRPAPAELAAVPRGYIRQLALYRALLLRLYPDRPVRAALIFTEVPQMLDIPADMLDAELATLLRT